MLRFCSKKETFIFALETFILFQLLFSDLPCSKLCRLELKEIHFFCFPWLCFLFLLYNICRTDTRKAALETVLFSADQYFLHWIGAVLCHSVLWHTALLLQRLNRTMILFRFPLCLSMLRVLLLHLVLVLVALFHLHAFIQCWAGTLRPKSRRCATFLLLVFTFCLCSLALRWFSYDCLSMFRLMPHPALVVTFRPAGVPQPEMGWP